MNGFEHNNHQSLTSILERVKNTTSSFDAAVTALFSVQQNQIDGLRKIGVVFPAPAPATANQAGGAIPEPSSILEALSRELDKFDYLNSMLQKQIEDARFIDQALFKQTVFPEVENTPVQGYASQTTGRLA